MERRKKKIRLLFTLIISPLKSQSNLGKKVSKFLQIKTNKKEELKE